MRASCEKTFLVVIDAFHNRTTELADVVLPAALWCEKEGIYGNTDRRTQHMAKAIEPKGEAKPDVWILLEIAKRMGYGEYFDHYTSNEVIWEEFRKMGGGNTGYDYAPYARYKEERGIRWPVNDRAAQRHGPRSATSRATTPSCPRGRASTSTASPTARRSSTPARTRIRPRCPTTSTPSSSPPAASSSTGTPSP